MSWNCLFIVARNADRTDLARIGIEPNGAPVTADEARRPSFPGVSAMQHGTDLVFINGDQSLMTAGPLLASLLERETVTALFAGVSDSYLWRVDSPLMERTWMAQGGETLGDTGLAIPEERGITTLDEDGLFSLLLARTGFGSDDAWLSAVAQPVTWPPSVPKPQPKKRWFAKP